MIMKTRSKLLLAAVSLLTVSVAATATSAYAWYTANRQVSANVSSMGVKSTSGSLSVSHISNADSFTAENSVTTNVSQSDKQTLTASTVFNITDVSSKGDGKFVKPKFGSNGSDVVGEYGQSSEAVLGQKTVNLTSSLTAHGVITLAIRLANNGQTGVTKPISVYLSPNNASLSGSVDMITKSARFSIVDLSDNKVKYYCSPTAEVESDGYKYLPTYDGSATEITDATILDKSAFFKGDKPLVTTSSVSNNVAANGYLCQIDANGYHDFLVTMWVEGTDKDCAFANVDDAKTTDLGSLSLALDLYALEA